MATARAGIDHGEPYGQLTTEIDAGFGTSAAYQAAYLVNQAANELCPASIWRLRQSAAATGRRSHERAGKVEGATTMWLTGKSACALVMPIGLATAILAGAPSAQADNKRLNDSVAANVYTIQHQQGCVDDIKVNAQLRLAAQWHADDVLDNRALETDVGSDGSTVQDRANAAGFRGVVAETVAVNPALAISGVEIMNQWYYRPDYMAIMSNCHYTQIGVWSENSLDRTVVVAVYGTPA